MPPGACAAAMSFKLHVSIKERTVFSVPPDGAELTNVSLYKKEVRSTYLRS